MLKDLFSNKFVWFGVIGYILLYYKVLHRKNSFLETLDHEISHTILAYLTGSTVTELKVTKDKGGHILHIGGSKTIITLAPYFLRIPTFFMAVAMSFAYVPLKYQWIFYILSGIIIAYHVICVFHEARPYQTDLQKTRVVRAYIMIVSLNILMFGIIGSMIAPRLDVIDYLKSIL